MATIDIYRGDSKRLDLTFTNDDGTPFILSGYALYFSVKQHYNDKFPLFTVSQLNHDVPQSGMTHITLSGVQTDQCPGEYLAGFFLADSQSGISTFETDGLKILPSVYPF